MQTHIVACSCYSYIRLVFNTKKNWMKRHSSIIFYSKDALEAQVSCIFSYHRHLLHYFFFLYIFSVSLHTLLYAMYSIIVCKATIFIFYFKWKKNEKMTRIIMRHVTFERQLVESNTIVAMYFTTIWFV